MSTIVIAIIIVAVIIFVFLFLISVNTRQRRQAANELVEKFHNNGIEHHLLINKWEVAGKLVIGLEAGKKTLLAFRKSFDRCTSHLVDLSTVRNCEKKKTFRSLITGNGRSEKHIEQIGLQFDFIDQRPPLLITFYEPGNNHLFEMEELEQKAKDWEQLVRTIIHQDPKGIVNHYT